MRDGVAQLLPAQKLRKGVKVASTDDGIVVDLYVVIEFGTNLAEVSHNLAESRPLRPDQHRRRPGGQRRRARAGRQSAYALRTANSPELTT